jgi:branched-chain amino acid transport system permease protein
MNIPQQMVNALWLGSVYSLFALGYALVFSVLGLLNLAHSSVFMWGAYIGFAAVTLWGLPLPIAGLIAVIGAGLLSLIVDRVAFYPLRQRDAPRIAQLISSIAVAAILVKIAQIRFTADPQHFPLDIVPDQPIAGIGLNITVIQILTLVIGAALMGGLLYLVNRTKQGQAMRTVAFNNEIAALMGVPVDAIYAMTFFIAGAAAGAAGILYGLSYNSLTPFMGDSIALKGLTVIVLGGIGSIRGAMIGGFIVAALEVFSIAVGGSSYRDAIIFLLLFLMLIIRPQGLFGQQATVRA